MSTLQTFRSWVVIFDLRRPMAFLSLSIYDMPGLAPRMNVLFWRPGDFPVRYSNRDKYLNAWNRLSGSFIVDTGSYSAIWSLPLTSVNWHSDPWPITVTSQPIRLSNNFMNFAWPSPITNGFYEAFATGVACQQGILTLPDPPPPWGDLHMIQFLETSFPDFVVSLLDISPWIPLGTFLMLLDILYLFNLIILIIILCYFSYQTTLLLQVIVLGSAASLSPFLAAVTLIFM